MMEAVRTFQTSVYFSETTRRYIPEDCQLKKITFYTDLFTRENQGHDFHLFYGQHGHPYLTVTWTTSTRLENLTSNVHTSVTLQAESLHSLLFYAYVRLASQVFSFLQH
jgi:hypothetical protein